MSKTKLVFSDNIELEVAEPKFNGCNLTNRVLREIRKDREDKKKDEKER